jgi:hypothetical protein
VTLVYITVNNGYIVIMVTTACYRMSCCTVRNEIMERFQFSFSVRVVVLVSCCVHFTEHVQQYE